jgi:hypothetical protein
MDPEFSVTAGVNAFPTELNSLSQIETGSSFIKQVYSGFCYYCRALVPETERPQLRRVPPGNSLVMRTQGRDGGIGVFQSKTRAVGDDSVGLGGRPGGAYLRRNM